MAGFGKLRQRLIFGTRRCAQTVAAIAIVTTTQAQDNTSRLFSEHRPAARRTSSMGEIGIVRFDKSPFPYDDTIPETGEPPTPFLSVDPDGRRFHIAPRAGKLYADTTYSDRRSLLYIPSRFEPDRGNACIVLYLHGNLALLERDVSQRQRVPQQLEASGLNAVLVAPQLAVDALDSSPGHFYKPGFLDDYLAEAARHLAALSKGRVTATELDALPVIIVAYSGGYLATAFSLKYALSEGRSRIAGVILLDALFGEEPKFADWVTAQWRDTFFVSAFSKASAPLDADLARTLEAAGIPVTRSIPAQIKGGDVVLKSAPDAVHNDFVTRAWDTDPLKILLGRIRLAHVGNLSAPR